MIEISKCPIFVAFLLAFASEFMVAQTCLMSVYCTYSRVAMCMKTHKTVLTHASVLVACQLLRTWLITSRCSFLYELFTIAYLPLSGCFV